MSRQYQTIGWSVPWLVAAAVLFPAANVHAQKKTGTTKPLPNIRYSLQFIGTSAIQPVGLMSPINDRGELVGNARFSEDSTLGPYLYQADLHRLIRLEKLVTNLVVIYESGETHTRHLVELYGTNDMGAYINNQGQVVARARVLVTDSSGSLIYFYDEGCRLSPLPDSLSPDGWERYLYESLGAIDPVAINDNGVVAGWDGWTVVVSHEPGSPLENIGNFNSDGTRPSAITGGNLEGDFHIVGWTSNSGGWIWHPDGTWTQPALSSGRANWVNGAVIGFDGKLLATGSARKSRRSVTAFRYTEGGAMEDLGSLGDNSYGNGINSTGRVVGDYQFDSTAGQRAFLYFDSTSGMTNLDMLINDFASPRDENLWKSTSTRTSAVGINTFDAISGQGTFDGAYRAFVLIPNN